MLSFKCDLRLDIIPCNFKKAIMEPENVIAPTAAPIDISIKLPSFIFPGTPRLNASGFKKAEIATIQQQVQQDCENLHQFWHSRHRYLIGYKSTN